MFRWCFAIVFASLHGVVPPRAVWKNPPILRSAFRENFRVRTLVFWVFVPCRYFLVTFCLCFCFIAWRSFPWELSDKNCLIPRSVFRENFRERTFGFWCLCSVEVFWYCFAYVFASLGGVVPPKVVWKLLLFLGPRFSKNFRERTLGFGICERSLVLVLFCLCSCFTVWFCSPESCLKRFFFLASCFAKIFGGEFWEFGTCARSMYFGAVLLMFLLYYVVLFSLKLSGTVRERTFVSWYFVLGQCFLVLFCQRICFIVWFCSPVICLKRDFLSGFFFSSVFFPGRPPFSVSLLSPHALLSLPRPSSLLSSGPSVCLSFHWGWVYPRSLWKAPFRVSQSVSQSDYFQKTSGGGWVGRRTPHPPPRLVILKFCCVCCVCCVFMFLLLLFSHVVGYQHLFNSVLRQRDKKFCWC